MKILLLALVITLGGESALARASLAKRFVQGTQAFALSVVLLAAPVGSFAASSDLSAGVEQQTQQLASPLGLAQQGESDFDGGFFRLGIVGTSDGGGLMLSGGVQHDPLTAGSSGIDVDIKLLAQRGYDDGSYVLNAESVVDGFSFAFAQEKIGLQWFWDVYMGAHEFTEDARQAAGTTMGVGVDALDDFLGQGQYTSVQLRAGVGWLINDQSIVDKEHQDDIDLDVVGTLKLIVKTDGLTFGDVLHKEHSSLWHWLPLVPKGKVSAALHKPVFDGNERHSGELIYSLQAQVGLMRHLYLILEHYDSPNYYDAYRRASLRWHLYGTP